MLSSRRIAVLLGLLASAVLAGPVRPALAQPSSKNQKQASALVKMAIAKSEAGDHQGAIDLYNEAYRLAPNSLLLSNIGAQYQELDQLEEALEYFCRYLKEDPSGTNAPYARSQAKIVQRQLGRKKGDACAAPPSSDDSTDASAPRRAGGERKPAEDPDKPDKPDRSDRSDKSDQTEDKVATDKPKPESTPLDDPPPPKPASGNPALMYTGLAAGIVGVAAAGISIYYGVQGKNVSDQISSHVHGTPWPPNIQTLMSDGETDNKLQVGFLIASGVLVTTGVVLYVVGRSDAAPEHTTSKTVVRVTPTANGFAVFGKF